MKRNIYIGNIIFTVATVLALLSLFVDFKLIGGSGSGAADAGTLFGALIRVVLVVLAWYGYTKIGTPASAPWKTYFVVLAVLLVLTAIVQALSGAWIAVILLGIAAVMYLLALSNRS